MADVEVTYKGSTIGSLSATGSLTLETAGTYCEDDIGIDYTSPGGGGGDETWYSGIGQLYKANMVIPDGMRYVRDHFTSATHLVSFIQQYGTPALDSDYGLFRGCTALETLWVARATFGSGCFDGCTALKTVTLGRIGLAVTSVPSAAFNGSPRITQIETVTVYVNASDLAGVPSAVKDRIVPTYSPGAQVIYKNYTSGDVIATVTVE